LLVAAAPIVVVVGVLVLLCVALFVVWRRSREYEKRVRRGLCVRCGYDVRASGEHCPECGAPIMRRRNPVTGEVIPPEG
jgi:predicted amidophosphoribosyltransferase